MRWLIAAGMALALGVGTASAQGGSILCKPYEQRWDTVSSGSNVAAMRRMIAEIPAACPALKEQALRELAEIVSASKVRVNDSGVKQERLEAAGSADDSAFAIAEAAGTDGAFRAYLARYPHGRHAREAEAVVAPRTATGSPPPAHTYTPPPAAPAAPAQAPSPSASADNAKGEAAYRSQNYPEALRWFKESADTRDPVGQDWVGFLYANGKGVSQDYQEAIGWFHMSADRGDATAMFHMGLVYATGGHGVTQNMFQARQWMNKAAERGDSDARAWLAQHPE